MTKEKRWMIMILCFVSMIGIGESLFNPAGWTEDANSQNPILQEPTPPVRNDQTRSADPGITPATGGLDSDPRIDAGLSGDTLGDNKGMTLYDLLEAGGWIVVVLFGLSIIALALVLYFFFVITQRKLVPRDMVVQIRHYLHDQRYEDIARLCRRSKGMFSKVVLAGITRGAEDPASVSVAMEAVGRREADTLMRKVRYLSDISTISPMLGILGTVLGMINAFNFIAFDISAVKPVALASAVAQALVTTAAGLIVAIPCMGFFFYFRGKLQSMIGEMEELAVEISDQMALLDAQPDPPPRSNRRKKNSKEYRMRNRFQEEEMDEDDFGENP